MKIKYDTFGDEDDVRGFRQLKKKNEEMQRRPRHSDDDEYRREKRASKKKSIRRPREDFNFLG